MAARPLAAGILRRHAMTVKLGVPPRNRLDRGAPPIWERRRKPAPDDARQCLGAEAYPNGELPPDQCSRFF